MKRDGAKHRPSFGIRNLMFNKVGGWFIAIPLSFTDN